MDPNPQDVLPLPPRPSLEQYKKRAKDLVKACKSDDRNAIGVWATKWMEALAGPQGLTITPRLQADIDRQVDQIEEFARRKMPKCALADAQFVIARAHGFESWPRFAKHLEGLARRSSPVSRYEAAADAIVTGDVATLERLLRENPELIRARSTREHRATLLHYVAANGVENYRQKTPKNAVKVAEILLQAGAEVDAGAAVYGGGWPTLGLVATSAHPLQAGVQEALMELLLEHGAAVDGAPRGRGLVVECLANGCPGAAEFLARRGAPMDLEAAAALGRLDLVRSFFREDGTLRANATKEQMTSGFRYACGYGRNDVVQFLLQKGVDMGAQDMSGQTAMHWAAIGGHVDTIKLLLEHQAPLEVRNVYGGTVLGQALWSAAHGGDPDVYVAIVEALIAAGAVVERHPPVNERVDDVLRRHGSPSDDRLWWYGEKPRIRK